MIVDAAIWEWRGERWAHLVSDESLRELHDFAQRLGKRRIGFQGDHYDIDTADRCRALTMGAEPVDSRVLVSRLRAAGLRQRGQHRTWRQIGYAPFGAGFDMTGLKHLGVGGVRMSHALSKIEPLVCSSSTTAFVNPHQLAVLLDFASSEDMAPTIDEPTVNAAALNVDECWLGYPRRDGERSLELFVTR